MKCHKYLHQSLSPSTAQHPPRQPAASHVPGGDVIPAGPAGCSSRRRGAAAVPAAPAPRGQPRFQGHSRPARPSPIPTVIPDPHGDPRSARPSPIPSAIPRAILAPHGRRGIPAGIVPTAHASPLKAQYAPMAHISAAPPK